MEVLTPEGKKARQDYMRDYMRGYRKNHKEKTRDADIRRWNKKGREAMFINTAIGDMTDDSNEGD